MAKFQLPSYIVVPDTNSLFTPKPEYIVSPQFNENWRYCCQITSLKLLIPEVVKQELVSRQMHIARQSLASALKNLKTIADITQYKPIKLPSEKALTSEVLGTFNKWRKKNAAAIINAPLKTINWKRLLNDAIGRVPPFSPLNDPEKSSEKGFRDAIILETLLFIADMHKKENIVFLTNDEMLKLAAENRFKISDSRMIFANAKEFAAWLRLLKETKAEEFTKQLLARASAFFFTPNDQKSLFYAFNISAEIDKTYGAAINNPSDQPFIAPKDITIPTMAPPQTRLRISSDLGIWTISTPLKPSSEEKIFIKRTDYEKVENETRYHWISKVEYVRLFRPEPPFVYTDGSEFSEKIRFGRFDVKWSALADENGNLSDGQLTSIDFTEQKLESAYLHKQAYGFAEPAEGPNIKS